MFDKVRLKEALVKYKLDFAATQWKNEQYKWEAIKAFQNNWDVNATDFVDMLSRSLSKTYNLLASAKYFPARMITKFAQAAPEEVRAMFLSLFDESIDVIERIMAFKDNSSILLEKYGNGAGQHYQHENAISTYLWLRYPDKYYIYKYSEAKTVADELGSDYHFKKGAYTENLRNFYSLYDEICEYIHTDTELTSLLQRQLTDTCYPDPEYRTLTVDVGFYISRYYSKKDIAIDTEQLHSEARFADWFVPLIETLKEMGGTAKRPDVHSRMQQNYFQENISEKDIKKTKNDIDWARNYLVYEGFIANDENGIWKLTDIGKAVQMTRDLAGKIIAK